MCQWACGCKTVRVEAMQQLFETTTVGIMLHV
jgi:hypothetical protein